MIKALIRLCGYAQADLRLCCLQSRKIRVSRVYAHMMLKPWPPPDYAPAKRQSSGSRRETFVYHSQLTTKIKQILLVIIQQNMYMSMVLITDVKPKTFI